MLLLFEGGVLILVLFLLNANLELLMLQKLVYRGSFVGLLMKHDSDYVHEVFTVLLWDPVKLTSSYLVGQLKMGCCFKGSSERREFVDYTTGAPDV